MRPEKSPKSFYPNVSAFGTVISGHAAFPSLGSEADFEPAYSGIMGNGAPNTCEDIKGGGEGD